MAKLEEFTPGSLVKGILPDAVAELVSAKWHGSDVIEVVYKDPAGRVGTEILFRDREPARTGSLFRCRRRGRAARRRRGVR